MKSKSLSWNSIDDLELIKKALHHDGIILGTSDTILGLLANVTQAGFSKLNEIKHRDQKPYIILISAGDKVSSFADIPSEHVSRLIANCWPGPLTLILNKNKACPAYINSGYTTVALRVPHHQGLLAILKDFKGLFSTSANISGQPVPATIESVDPEIIKKVDYLIDKSSYNSVPSTILDCTSHHIKVIRSGAYDSKELEKVAGTTFIK